jgi:hypothetical protein
MQAAISPTCRGVVEEQQIRQDQFVIRLHSGTREGAMSAIAMRGHLVAAGAFFPFTSISLHKFRRSTGFLTYQWCAVQVRIEAAPLVACKENSATIPASGYSIHGGTPRPRHAKKAVILTCNVVDSSDVVAGQDAIQNAVGSEKCDVSSTAIDTWRG